ncbi:MAG: hypothetical protein NWQ19_09435, partial [Nonlabens sp.]|nr:hypothetical protein [Nonlabens sp.]
MKAGKYVILVCSLLAVLAVKIAYQVPEEPVEVAIKKDYKIINKWEMPSDLLEISGVAWLSKDEIACVQDEDGFIFIYNLKTKKIVEHIQFGESGDYEAIAVNGKDAYVLRSDGTIFEVSRFRESELKTTYFKSVFGTKNNMESLTMDIDNNRLVTITKDRDPYSDDYKGLYQIPLATKKTDIKPILKINMMDGALEDYQQKKSYRNFYPSDVAVHPISGDYYILEGRSPRLIIMDKTG